MLHFDADVKKTTARHPMGKLPESGHRSGRSSAKHPLRTTTFSTRWLKLCWMLLVCVWLNSEESLRHTKCWAWMIFSTVRLIATTNQSKSDLHADDIWTFRIEQKSKQETRTFLWFAGPCCADEVNLALGKPAYQSSTHSWAPSKAVGEDCTRALSHKANGNLVLKTSSAWQRAPSAFGQLHAVANRWCLFSCDEGQEDLMHHEFGNSYPFVFFLQTVTLAHRTLQDLALTHMPTLGPGGWWTFRTSTKLDESKSPTGETAVVSSTCKCSPHRSTLCLNEFYWIGIRNINFLLRGKIKGTIVLLLDCWHLLKQGWETRCSCQLCAKSFGHILNKKQCSRQLQCEVPCGVSNVVNSSLFINSSLSYLSSTSHTVLRGEGSGHGGEAWVGGGGLGEGRGLGGGDRGHFHPPAMYCTTTWCFALKRLRTIIASGSFCWNLMTQRKYILIECLK